MVIRPFRWTMRERHQLAPIGIALILRTSPRWERFALSMVRREAEGAEVPPKVWPVVPRGVGDLRGRQRRWSGDWCAQM
jgi:hypothetical protein